MMVDLNLSGMREPNNKPTVPPIKMATTLIIVPVMISFSVVAYITKYPWENDMLKYKTSFTLLKLVIFFYSDLASEVFLPAC